MDLSIEGGFSNLVLAAQGVFRATMEALAHPGQAQAIGTDAAPPAPLTPDLGAMALTLCDHDTLVWLDPELRKSQQVTAWLAFHCGAPITDHIGEAAFALVTDSTLMPRLESMGQGTDEYPDRSTTVILAAGDAETAVKLKGPGINGDLRALLPLPNGDFLAQWADNRECFPRGIDLLLVRNGTVTGLPRTTRIDEA
jgi:alpha-D-ribose 1-methylphosphonate 5-triphosphate synthase subunit PhnH